MEKKVYSYAEFILERYNVSDINEDKGGEGIDEALIIKILDKQKEMANLRLKGKKNAIIELQVKSREMYDKMGEKDKKQLLSDFIKKAEKVGVDSKWIEKKLKNVEEGQLLKNPRIIITEKSTTIPDNKKPTIEKDETPKEFIPAQLIPNDAQGTFFKDNQWEYNKDDLKKTFQESYTVNGDTAKGEDVIKQIVEGMKAYAEIDFNMKGKGVKSIKISTSCSRYRNLGNAEKISWAQLGFNRSQTFVKMLAAAASEASDGDKAFVSEFIKKVEVSYLGSNGDGTSGPDPIEKNFKRGYYDSKGWHDKSVSNTLDISVVDVTTTSGGIKLGESKKVKAKDILGAEITKELTTKDEYEPFKFAAIEIIALPLTDSESPGDDDKKPIEDVPEPVETKSHKYVITLNDGKSNKGGGKRKRKWDFPPVKFFGGRGPKRGKFSVNACPIF
jgi:hypothetical protein